MATVTAPMLATALLASSMVAAPAANALVGDPVGDPAADGERPYVVKLTIGTDERACSGALIEELWVLTAASCFVEDPAHYATLASGAPDLATRAIVGRTDLATSAGPVRDVVELVPLSGRDAALARLDSPVTNVEPVSLGLQPVVVGDTVEATGYGRTADQWAPMRMHREDFAVIGSTTTGLQINSESGGVICMGDAGGPIVRRGIDGDELVAVTSRSWQGGCFGSSETRTAAVATRVDDLTEHVIGPRVARWALRSRMSNRYVTTETGRTGNLAGVLRAGSGDIHLKQVYTLHTMDDGATLAFRSEKNGLFVTAEIGRTDDYQEILRARAEESRAWEQFTLERMADGSYAIRSEANGKYLQVHPEECCDVNEDSWLVRADGEELAPVLQGFKFEHVDNFRVNGTGTLRPQPMAGLNDASAPAESSDELPPFVVEDFNYPGADRILEERGFELKRGDGHIVLADCSEANVLSVSARGLGNEDVCFRTAGDAGWLTLELAGAYLVHTNDYTMTELETTVEGEVVAYAFGPNQWGPVGEAVDPEAREHVLVEIRVSK